MDTTTLAYLAGAVDSDGCIGIFRGRHNHPNSSANFTYSGQIILKQVTPEVPALLQKTFKGSFARQGGKTAESVPLYSWAVGTANAGAACEILLPLLLVKRRQAELVLELRETTDPKYRRSGYWFAEEFPRWEEMEMLTASQVQDLLNLPKPAAVQTLERAGHLLTLPSPAAFGQPRFPRPQVERLAAVILRGGRVPTMPDELLAWRQSLYERSRRLNGGRMVVTGDPALLAMDEITNAP